MLFRFQILTLSDPGTLGVPDDAPYSVWWLARHIFANIGKETARSLDDIARISAVADSICNNMLDELRKNAFTRVIGEYTDTASCFSYHDDVIDQFMAKVSRGEDGLRFPTEDELKPLLSRSGGELIQTFFERYFSSEERAREAVSELVHPSLRPLSPSEILYAFALREIDLALQEWRKNSWCVAAVNHFGNASVATAIGGGKMSYGILTESLQEFASHQYQKTGSKGGKARSAKFDSCKAIVWSAWKAKQWEGGARKFARDKSVIDSVMAESDRMRLGLIRDNLSRTIKAWLKEREAEERTDV